MFLLKIAQLGNPVIRSGSEPLSQEELKTPSLQNLIDAMIQTMRDADGVGIAAPQVHVAKRIIVIEVSPDNPRYPHRQTVPLTVIINPEITCQSEENEVVRLPFAQPDAAANLRLPLQKVGVAVVAIPLPKDCETNQKASHPRHRYSNQ